MSLLKFYSLEIYNYKTAKEVFGANNKDTYRLLIKYISNNFESREILKKNGFIKILYILLDQVYNSQVDKK
jgi:hypothetical protein